MGKLVDNLTERWQSLSPIEQDTLIVIGVIMAAWLIRQIFQPLLVGWLRRLSARTQNQWDDVIISVLDAPMRYLMVAVILAASVQLINLKQTVGVFINHVASTLVIIAVFLIIYRVGSRITQTPLSLRRVTSLRVEEPILPFLRTGLRFLLIALTLVIIIEEWGYNVNGLIAGLGVGGLAVALAAQDTLANLFGFSTIVGDSPFVEGEYIVNESATGTVEKVGLRSTRIRQIDQALVTVPNSKLAATPITNWSRLSKRQMNVIIGVNYETSSDAMRTLLHRLREMLKSREKVDAESVVVIFKKFGDNALEILIRCYILLPDWTEFHLEQEQIFLDMMDIMQEMGVRIAFPSRSIYIESDQPKSKKIQPPPQDENYKPLSDDLAQDDFK